MSGSTTPVWASQPRRRGSGTAQLALLGEREENEKKKHTEKCERILGFGLKQETHVLVKEEKHTGKCGKIVIFCALIGRRSISTPGNPREF